MSISAVKNNMYQSYSICGTLESNLSQLISLLNTVDGSTANKVSNYVTTIEYSVSKAKNLFEKMYHLNSVELHIFFSELNSKNREMNTKMTMLKKDLAKLKKVSIEIYQAFERYESMEFLGSNRIYIALIITPDLKKYIPILNMLKSELQIFKMMIDKHNRKLIIGARR